MSKPKHSPLFGNPCVEQPLEEFEALGLARRPQKGDLVKINASHNAMEVEKKLWQILGLDSILEVIYEQSSGILRHKYGIQKQITEILEIEEDIGKHTHQDPPWAYVLHPTIPNSVVTLEDLLVADVPYESHWMVTPPSLLVAGITHTTVNLQQFPLGFWIALSELEVVGTGQERD